jgi:hypothetical protein
MSLAFMPLSPSEASQVVRSAVMSLPEVTAKRMFGADAFFTRHRMFAFVLDDVIVLKLPDDERQRVLDARLARPYLTSAHVTFGRWVELMLGGKEGAASALTLVGAAYTLAQMPDREGPRRRRTSPRRRKSRKRVTS